MKVVVDTNVFVSGIFWTGPPALVLEAWHDGRIELVLSPAILEEYRRVAVELRRRFPAIDLDPILGAVALSSCMVPDSELPERVCSDPEDDKFIAAALTGKARYIITGDKKLLSVRACGSVLVVPPSTFVRTCLT